MDDAIVESEFVAPGEPPASAFDGVVRVPREGLSLTRLLPLLAGTRQLDAGDEGSVAQLVAYWRADDIGVRFARLVELAGCAPPDLPEPIAVTSFMATLRRDALRRSGLALRGSDAAALDGLRRLGAALARYHLDGTAQAEWGGAQQAGRLAELGGQLDKHGWPQTARDRLASALPGIETLGGETVRAATLKGLDVQNVLADGEGRLLLLDPGSLKTGYREADVARFLVSCRLVLWSTPAFPLSARHEAPHAQAFLAGYYGEERPTPLLALICAAETLETWRKAYGALAHKPWPGPLKLLLRRRYIEPVFARWLAADLAAAAA